MCLRLESILALKNALEDCPEMKFNFSEEKTYFQVTSDILSLSPMPHSFLLWVSLSPFLCIGSIMNPFGAIGSFVVWMKRPNFQLAWFQCQSARVFAFFISQLGVFFFSEFWIVVWLLRVLLCVLFFLLQDFFFVVYFCFVWFDESPTIWQSYPFSFFLSFSSSLNEKGEKLDEEGKNRRKEMRPCFTSNRACWVFFFCLERRRGGGEIHNRFEENVWK